MPSYDDYSLLREERIAARIGTKKKKKNSEWKPPVETYVRISSESGHETPKSEFQVRSSFFLDDS